MDGGWPYYCVTCSFFWCIPLAILFSTCAASVPISSKRTTAPIARLNVLHPRCCCHPDNSLLPLRYNGFAKGMMAKMGWEEGQGLGKDKQGRATYVQVKKKDDNAGLGKERAQQNNVNDQWYFDAFDSALANMGGKKKKKDKKSKKKAG